MVISELASQLDRKDEQPNIELARRLVNEKDYAGVKEVIENLSNKNKKIQSDCIKVVYEVGEMEPEMISNYALIFIDLLNSRNNRLVWGSMSALSTIASEASEVLMNHVQEIISAMKTGSVITVDKGVMTLAKLASVNEMNNERIFPVLIQHLETCRVKEIPQHAESTLIAVTEHNKEHFITTLKQRAQYMTAPQYKRIKKIYKSLNVE
ncbi:hypothetical protein [Pseudalkalibacillus berkeleyi]|uniref:HEAT repeat domain-containing protein n=1 Tax=Pseudalkalibacillus berkeleyi TaxID=1069813 RepID=A0ABS9GWW0_9BACL|nr:hypothetical protein [Pseudalkalibacillus berkeleyi]MCF6136306.1 hypothetical protein [Pseudalkalibacillus berkeleyi]